MDLLFAVAAGYLIGSVPFAWLIGRLCYGLDLRKVGDRNVGGGNLMAVAGFLPGFVAIVLDVAKGFAATEIGLQSGGSEAGMFAAVGCLVGHVWPAWLGFDGGRGAAAVLGVATGFFPWLMAVLLPAAIALLALTRRTVVTLAAIMPVIPFAAVALGEPAGEAVFVALVFVCVGAKDAWDRLRREPEAEPARVNGAEQ